MGTDVDEFDCFGNGMAKTVLVTGAIDDECIEDELFDVVRYIALYLGCITTVGQGFWVYPWSMGLSIRAMEDDIFG